MQSAECSIVFLEEKDAPALAALEASVFPSAWSAAQYGALLRALDLARKQEAKPPFMVLGLFAASPAPPDGADNGPAKLAAYISLGLHHAAGEAEIYNIACAPAHRRRGFARALLARALEEAGRMGLERTILEVRESNTAALGLYRAFGFCDLGRRKNYYTDTGEDALVLARPFEKPS